jgi:hypothetical protein
MNGCSVTLLIIFLVSAMNTHAARVYKWSDSSGIHYSDRPPESGTKRKVISVDDAPESKAPKSHSAKRRRHSPNQPPQSHQDVERRNRNRASRRGRVSPDISIRSIDGSDNNLGNPDWGRADVAFIPLARMCLSKRSFQIRGQSATL